MTDFDNFKNKYNLHLNDQQEKAVKFQEGPCLLLAVPGSGKTSVIIAKLGYMICCRNIRPESILAVTFNRLAATEIRNRFIEKFGVEKAEGLSIQTINSLSLSIYSRFCRDTGHPFREIIDPKDKKMLINSLYRKYSEDKYPSESDIIEVENAFSYIKNMCIKKDDIGKKFKTPENLEDMFEQYERTLKKLGKMDFDDQMCFALWILEHASMHREYWQNRYNYIYVDEAQDTSLIQHKIIKILSGKSMVFMVGDEDQSIYGFRGAYPAALINFTKNYPNGQIIKMETNYRSMEEIVKTSERFVNRNRDRFRKHMTSARGNGAVVKIIETASREDQFDILFKAAEKTDRTTAFLYRDNESGIPLIDRLLRSGIPFSYNGGKSSFFTQKIVQDYFAYLRLVINNDDLAAFSQIGTKSSLRLSRDDVNYITAVCRRRNFKLFDELQNRRDKTGNIETFITLIKNLKKSDTLGALRKIRAVVYSLYTEKFKIDDSSVEILMALAEKESDIEQFLYRMEDLKNFCENSHRYNQESRITVSTIHSSKGMEFDTVYIYDLFDGKMPSGDIKQLQEERRLFYVAMTRAENNLNMLKIKKRKSSFIDEVSGRSKNLYSNQ